MLKQSVTFADNIPNHLWKGQNSIIRFLNLSPTQCPTSKSAQRFATIILDIGGKSILMGGGASIMLGHMGRTTKDLDFNLNRLTLDMQKALGAKGITIKPSDRALRFSANIPATPGKWNATSIDLAVRSDLKDFLIKYTREIDGVTIANEQLLLVDKIRTFVERAGNADQKRDSDLKDIEFCMLKLTDDEKKLM